MRLCSKLASANTKTRATTTSSSTGMLPIRMSGLSAVDQGTDSSTARRWEKWSRAWCRKTRLPNRYTAWKDFLRRKPANGDTSLHGIVRNYFPIPLRTQFGRAFLRFEIDVVQAEALAVPIRPFEIVH